MCTNANYFAINQIATQSKSDTENFFSQFRTRKIRLCIRAALTEQVLIFWSLNDSYKWSIFEVKKFLNFYTHGQSFAIFSHIYKNDSREIDYPHI